MPSLIYNLQQRLEFLYYWGREEQLNIITRTVPAWTVAVSSNVQCTTLCTYAISVALQTSIETTLGVLLRIASAMVSSSNPVKQKKGRCHISSLSHMRTQVVILTHW